MPYRVGNHWGVTIVWEGELPPDHEGRRPDDKLAGMINHGDKALAERIVRLLNEDDARRGLPTFAADLKAGRVAASQIQEYVAAWETSVSSLDLPEYLGLAWNDYMDWRRTGELPKNLLPEETE